LQPKELTHCCMIIPIVGRPLGKRYDAEFFLEEGVKGSHACEYLFTVDVEQTIWRGFKFANWFASQPISSGPTT